MVNTRLSIKSYTEFYHTEEAEDLLLRNKLFQNLKCVTDLDFYSLLLNYTGLEAGFGFFAPNVASEYVTEFEVYSKDSVFLYSANFPKMGNKESIARLTTAYQMFQEYMNEKTDSMELKKCEILLKGLSLKVLNENERAFFVSSSVYLHHHPLLEQLEQDPQMKPIYKLLKLKTYTKDEAW